MNEITATASLPPRADLRKRDDEVQAVVDDVVTFWPNDGTQPILRRALTRDERGQMRSRQRDLQMVLRPLNLEERKHAAKALAAMFLGFPNMRAADAQATVAAYIMALEQYPLFAIAEACADVTNHRVEINPDFPPTAPRMCEIATRHIAPLRGELALVEKVMTGKVYDETLPSPEERERVKIGLQELAKAMMERDQIQRREHLTHQAVVMKESGIKMLLNEYRRLGIDPIYADADKKILLSPALAGKVKI